MDGFTRTGLTLVAALAMSAPVTGSFALLGGTPKVTAQMAVRQNGGKTSLDVYELQSGSNTPVVKYDSDMTKLMHMIVISDDFSTFMHVHPAFNAKTGHFTIALPLDPTREYIVYTDTDPAGAGQQVFRFLLPAQRTAPVSVPAGQPTNNPIAATTPSPAIMTAGPYKVAMRTTFLANAMQMLPLSIQRNGKPATDLQPYLGAAAHAVFINTSDLSYVHVHPMVHGKMGIAGPNMTVHVPPLPVGTYRLWLQFEGGSKLYTVPLTIAVR